MNKLLIALLLGFTINANAGLLLEPYIGYNFAAVEDDGEGSAATGAMVGGRVGMTILGTAFIALDYSTGKLDWEPEGGSTAELDGTMTRAGITVGADIPVAPIRLWAGWYQMEYDPGLNDLEGDGIKLGAGLTVLPIVDINLEYFNGEFDENDGISIDDVTEKGLMLSVSAPFDL
jgi:hypothetical protein